MFALRAVSTFASLLKQIHHTDCTEEDLQRFMICELPPTCCLIDRTRLHVKVTQDVNLRESSAFNQEIAGMRSETRADKFFPSKRNGAKIYHCLSSQDQLLQSPDTLKPGQAHYAGESIDACL